MSIDWQVATVDPAGILLAMYDVLETISYPVHPATDRAPEVFFVDTDADVVNERVELSPEIEGEAEWASTGHLLADIFNVTISHISMVPGYTGREALARIRTLGNATQNAFRNPSTGLPDALGLQVVNVQNFRVSGYTLTATVLSDKGWGWTYDLTYRLETIH